MFMLQTIHYMQQCRLTKRLYTLNTHDLEEPLNLNEFGFDCVNKFDFFRLTHIHMAHLRHCFGFIMFSFALNMRRL